MQTQPTTTTRQRIDPCLLSLFLYRSKYRLLTVNSCKDMTAFLAGSVLLCAAAQIPTNAFPMSSSFACRVYSSSGVHATDSNVNSIRTRATSEATDNVMEALDRAMRMNTAAPLSSSWNGNDDGTNSNFVKASTTKTNQNDDARVSSLFVQAISLQSMDSNTNNASNIAHTQMNEEANTVQQSNASVPITLEGGGNPTVSSKTLDQSISTTNARVPLDTVKLVDSITTNENDRINTWRWGSKEEKMKLELLRKTSISKRKIREARETFLSSPTQQGALNDPSFATSKSFEQMPSAMTNAKNERPHMTQDSTKMTSKRHVISTLGGKVSVPSTTNKFVSAQQVATWQSYLIGSLFGTLAMAPVSIWKHYFLLDPIYERLAQLEWDLAAAMVSGAVFASTYRYLVRQDWLNEDFLSRNLLMAFVLVRTLVVVDVPMACSTPLLYCKSQRRTLSKLSVVLSDCAKSHLSFSPI